MPQRSTTAGNTLEKFTGKERDESIGLDYFGARYYDPALGRWNGVDPMADKFPHVSPYAYVENDPISYFDPNGAYRIHAAQVAFKGNVVRLTRWSVSQVQAIEAFNSVASFLPGGGFVKGVFQGLGNDPSYQASGRDAFASYASLAVPFTSSASGVGRLARGGLVGNSLYDAGSAVASEFTPSSVGFDESLFGVLGSLKSGSENIFTNTGDTSLELNSAIANAGKCTIGDAEGLTKDYIEGASGLLRGIANSKGLGFSSSSDREAIMQEYQKHKDIYDQFINAIVGAGEEERRGNR